MMTNSENLRDIVCDVLLDIEKNQTPSHVAIRRMLEKYQYLEGRDRHFISRVTKGTLERQISLDWIINAFSSVKVKKMKPVIRTVLRMSVYQLKYMDNIPSSAVCNEAVKLVKKRGFKSLAGFVNGILRNVVRHPEKMELPEDQMGIFYSQPEWLVSYWSEIYGEGRTREMFGYFLKDQPLTVRVCTNKVSPEQFKTKMEEQGVSALQNPWVESAFELKGFDYLGALKAFREGECTVQDVSSMLVAKAADIKPSYKVIDVCAAPGGKSIQISELLEEDGQIIARDLTPLKVEMIEENIRRMGAEHIEAQCRDALVFVPEDEETADVVIADLPCSGLGVIGRKADIKYRVERKDLNQLAQLQRDILKVVSAYVKPGGCLIYSTCTVSQEENVENVKWFSENFPFEPDSLHGLLPDGLGSDTLKQGYIQILPGEYGTDGFFIARFRRKQ